MNVAKKIYRKEMVFIVVLVFSFSSGFHLYQKIKDASSETKVIPGHAHNDYENEDPLHDALQYDALQQNHSTD